MGNKWINPNEFSQMLGRAGRPSYHDRGIVYLLPEIGNDFQGESEEAMALELLESNSEDVYIEYDEESSYEQILADISSTSIKSVDELNKFYKNIEIDLDYRILYNVECSNPIHYNKTSETITLEKPTKKCLKWQLPNSFQEVY